MSIRPSNVVSQTFFMLAKKSIMITTKRFIGVSHIKFQNTVEPLTPHIKIFKWLYICLSLCIYYLNIKTEQLQNKIIKRCYSGDILLKCLKRSQQNQRRKQSKKDKVVKIEMNRNHFIIVAAVSRLSQFGAYFQGHQWT